MWEFDAIAEEWDEYRSKPSTVLKLFLPLVQRSDVVLDAGCGNARNLLELAKKCALAYGIDSSKKMLENAREKTKKSNNVVLVNAGITKIPLPPKTVNKVFCLAVLHHLRTRKERLATLEEFARVLKGDGLALVSVWNKKQKKFVGKGDDALIKWKKKDGSIVERFYHFFSEEELAVLAGQAGFRVKELFYEKNGAKTAVDGAFNLCAMLEKP